MKNFGQHYFKEAVLMPDINKNINPAYKKILSKTKNMNVIISTLKKIMKDALSINPALNVFVELNNTLPSYNGLVGAGYNSKKNYYVLTIGPDILTILADPSKSESFYKNVLQHLEHENIHKQQNDRANPNRKQSYIDVNKLNDQEEYKKYLGTKKEIMAYAYMAAQDLKETLIKRENVLSLLRIAYSKKVEAIKGLIPLLGTYIDNFAHDSEEIKRFLKYVYDYITIHWEKL